MSSMHLNLSELLARPEGQQLAFVRRAFRADELAETLAALANAQGGVAVIGVSGRGKKVEGVGDIEQAQLATLDAALACTPPLVLPLPEVAPHGDLWLLLLTVPPGLPHVYSVHGKYLRREGPSNQPIPPDGLRSCCLNAAKPAGSACRLLAQVSMTLTHTSWPRMSAELVQPPKATRWDFCFGAAAWRAAQGLGDGSWGMVVFSHPPIPNSQLLVMYLRMPAYCYSVAMSTAFFRSARSRWCATVAAR